MCGEFQLGFLLFTYQGGRRYKRGNLARNIPKPKPVGVDYQKKRGLNLTQKPDPECSVCGCCRKPKTNTEATRNLLGPKEFYEICINDIDTRFTGFQL